MGRSKRKQPGRGFFWWVKAGALATLVVVVAAACGLAAIWPRCHGDECPSVEALREHRPPQASLVFDADGRLLARLAPEERIVISLEGVPAHVPGAFLAVEDKRFYEHSGVDWRRVGGAVWANARAGGIREGFSTITMQLARNVFPSHLPRDKTLSRKLWEVVLAWQIEQAFSKREILEIYLNQIYFGDGLYGLEAAARGYFGRPAKALTVAEAAVLAALPKAPSTYNPRRNPDAARRRRDLVLALMRDANVISPDAAEMARREPITLAPPLSAEGHAPYFIEAVRRELRERYGADADTAGYRIHTTLDPLLQKAAETEVARQAAAAEAGAFGKWTHAVCSKGDVESPDDCFQGMYVALDPRNGDVRALVGGRDFRLSQFDRATQARRQSGSAFKPIVYAAALSSGMTLAAPLELDRLEEGDYRPADGEAGTKARNVREALRVSSNLATVVVGERAGLGRVIQTAADLGITTPIGAYPSTFLGASEVSPLELVAAYAPFVNGGARVTPRLIQRIEDANGAVLWRVQPRREQALSPQVAFLTADLLRDVIDRGTGRRARVPGLPSELPIAGKTGTTNDSQDVWFVGATPQLVAGVWMGFDKPRRISSKASGGLVAAPVWGRVMQAYMKGGRPIPPAWSPPLDVVQHEIDLATGLRPTSRCPEEDRATEWFVAGTEPREECALHPEVGIDGFFRRAMRGMSEWFK